MDRLLDSAGTGPAYLRLPEIAAIVADAIHFQHRQLVQFQLHSWVVMPNHVHLFVTPLAEVSRFMHTLKRFTAKEANRVLGRHGQPFWQDESYDRLVRDDVEFGRIARYIRVNPARAGLVAAPEDYAWFGEGPVGNRPAG